MRREEAEKGVGGEDHRSGISTAITTGIGSHMSWRGVFNQQTSNCTIQCIHPLIQGSSHLPSAGLVPRELAQIEPAPVEALPPKPHIQTMLRTQDVDGGRATRTVP